MDPAAARSARRGSRPGEAEPGGEIQGADLAAQAADLLRAHSSAAQVVGAHRPPLTDREGPQAEDGPRRADHPVETAADDLLHRGGDRLRDVGHHLPLVPAVEGVGAYELLGQADDAQLQALRHVGAGSRALRQLDAAAADVDHDRGAPGYVYAVHRRAMDEARLLGPRDDADLDAGPLADGVQELAPVVRLADGARRGGDDLVHVVRLGQARELAERLEGREHRRLGERAPAEAAGAEPDHLLLAVDDLERAVRPYLHDDDVDGIGADVDGGDAHAGTGRGGEDRFEPASGRRLARASI